MVSVKHRPWPPHRRGGRRPPWPLTALAVSRAAVGRHGLEPRLPLVTATAPRLPTAAVPARPRPGCRGLTAPGNEMNAALTLLGRYESGIHLICSRRMFAGGLTLGKPLYQAQRTRPPPCMRWRGPRLASPLRGGQLPGFPGAARRPPVPGTRVRRRFPGSLHVPEFPPAGTRFQRWSISIASGDGRARACRHSFLVFSPST